MEFAESIKSPHINPVNLNLNLRLKAEYEWARGRRPNSIM